MRNLSFSIVFLFIALAACNNPKEHTAPAIYPRDSVAMMTSYGVKSMISDSGVMKYRVLAERWEVNENVHPPRQIFPRGIFMEQFDDKFHIEAFVQADTAYYFEDQKLWHLIGNVRARTVDGLRFSSEELYWDQVAHELYSNVHSHLITPERDMQGSYFRSDERLTKYYISNSKGSFEQSDMEKNDNSTAPGDTTMIQQPKRVMTTPFRKTAL